jgi:hypothetical protein
MSRFLFVVALVVAAGAGYMVGDTAAAHRRSTAQDAAEVRWQAKLADVQAQADAVEHELREENKVLAGKLDEAGDALSVAAQQYLKDLDAAEQKSADAVRRAEHEATEAKRALREAEIAASDKLDELHGQLERAQDVAQTNYDAATSLQQERDDTLAANREWAQGAQQTHRQATRNAYGRDEGQVVANTGQVMSSPENVGGQVIGQPAPRVEIDGRSYPVRQFGTKTYVDTWPDRISRDR